MHGVCVHVLSSNGAQRFEELQFFASRDFIFQPWRFLLVTPSHQEMLNDPDLCLTRYYYKNLSKKTTRGLE